MILASTLWATEPIDGTWELDIATSRIDHPEILKAVETTFSEKDGWLILNHVQYRVNGRVLKWQKSLRLDGTEHPILETPGVMATTTRLDADTIQTIEKTSGKVSLIGIFRLLPNGTVLALVQSFKPDGNLLSDETQHWHRR